MKRLKPARLNFGDTIGIIAPASPPQDPKAIDRAAVALEKFGFKVKLGENVRARNGFLAGSDKERAADVMAMFADTEVKAIFCLRGGYGAVRILDLLDYKVIRHNPKIFVGYSDLTSLHGELQKKVNLVSFHAPMAGALAADDLPEFTRASFFRTLMEVKPAGSICAGYDKKGISTLRCGVAEGRLLGGNLSVLCADIGTRFEPKFNGRILFLEDVGERPYRLDRLLTQLLNAGVFEKVSGVAIGVNKDCEDKPENEADDGVESKNAREYRQSSADVFAERLSALKIPVVTGLPFGHVALNATLPVGAKAKLDGDNGDLIITEAAVC
jgi:muramoyltetrapeptide carboxypeptidase